MAMVGWVSYARLVRAQVLTLKQRDFILAARSLGYGHLRILFRHLLPNALTGAIIFSMSDCVLVLLNGASVSYLGLGVQPPYRRMGDYGGRRAELYYHRMVDNHLSGACHRAAGDGLQPAGRWAGR